MLVSPARLLLMTMGAMNIVHCGRYPDYNKVIVMSDHSDDSDVMIIRDNQTEFRERERRSFYRSGASLGQYR